MFVVSYPQYILFTYTSPKIIISQHQRLSESSQSIVYLFIYIYIYIYIFVFYSTHITNLGQCTRTNIHHYCWLILCAQQIMAASPWTNSRGGDRTHDPQVVRRARYHRATAHLYFINISSIVSILMRGNIYTHLEGEKHTHTPTHTHTHARTHPRTHRHTYTHTPTLLDQTNFEINLIIRIYLIWKLENKILDLNNKLNLKLFNFVIIEKY